MVGEFVGLQMAWLGLAAPPYTGDMQPGGDWVDGLAWLSNIAWRSQRCNTHTACVTHHTASHHTQQYCSRMSVVPRPAGTSRLSDNKILPQKITQYNHGRRWTCATVRLTFLADPMLGSTASGPGCLRPAAAAAAGRATGAAEKLLRRMWLRAERGLGMHLTNSSLLSSVLSSSGSSFEHGGRWAGAAGAAGAPSWLHASCCSHSLIRCCSDTPQHCIRPGYNRHFTARFSPDSAIALW